MFAADAQFTNANPSFGQGVKGYARYFGASYGDFIIGNYMSEAILPDPPASGSPLFSARHRKPTVTAGVCHRSNLLDPHRFRSDSVQLLGDSWQFDRGCDFKRVLSRTTGTSANSATKFGMQIGVDMASNILKEFWPDMSRRFSRKHRQ